ncbi:hypothetical protein [Streptomyces sp. NPDC101237]|uniref:hypothetical protein n=1 Tax=Streptomyces sp. NPDC101237 TaxID=3366139 RepID=UPI00381C09D2
MSTAPMAPRWIFTLQGWNAYVHEMIKRPDLADSAPFDIDTPVTSDDPRLRYHGHLLLVPNPAFDAGLLKAHRLLLVNRNRREGLMDRVIDGPPAPARPSCCGPSAGSSRAASRKCTMAGSPSCTSWPRRMRTTS